MHLRAISKRKGSQGQVGYVLHIYVIFFPVINFIIPLKSLFKREIQK